ncbi:hypothetical protein NDU88_004145 [Pleurodeles waltl]|uniref:Uncharacterized protein n=1 Tax=Pleurodeles waltl TaxID=8319 RepID=A0AAV7TRR6_PLEWA|nr:hypothetical protein NDU88_004145 [Pleurodeles waltl]
MLIGLCPVRILPHTNPPCPQKVFEIYRSREPLSISCPSLRAQISPKNIYQMPSTSGSLSQEKKAPGLSILRRLVNKSKDIHRSTQVNEKVRFLTDQSRIHNQLGEVQPSTSTQYYFSGSKTEHRIRHRMSHVRETTKVTNPREFHTQKTKGYSPSLQITIGYDVFMHTSDPSVSAKDAPLVGAAKPSMASSIRNFRRPDTNNSDNDQDPQVVVSKASSLNRSLVSSTASPVDHNNRCLTGRLGRSITRPENKWQMANSSGIKAYQLARTQGSAPRLTSVPPKNLWIASGDKNGQHHYDALSQQARRYKISHPLQGSPSNLELGLAARRHTIGGAFAGNKQKGSRCTQQAKIGLSRVGTRPDGTNPDFFPVGNTNSGSVCKEGQRQMPVLRKLASPKGILGECVFDSLVRHLCLRLSSYSVDPKGPHEDENRTVHSHTDSPILAAPTLVHRAPHSVSQTSYSTGAVTSFTNNEQRPSSTPRSAVNAVSSMAPHHREFAHLNIPQDCRNILSQARADSTNKAYQCKWKRFCA